MNAGLDATAMFVADTEVSNRSPLITFLCGLDQDGEYQIESSEADSLSAVVADAATLNMVW